MIRKILIGIALLIVIPVAALLAYHVATPGSGSVQMKAMKVALRAFGKVTDPAEHLAKLRTQPPVADPISIRGSSDLHLIRALGAGQAYGRALPVEC